MIRNLAAFCLVRSQEGILWKLELLKQDLKLKKIIQTCLMTCPEFKIYKKDLLKMFLERSLSKIEYILQIWANLVHSADNNRIHLSAVLGSPFERQQ